MNKIKKWCLALVCVLVANVVCAQDKAAQEGIAFVGDKTFAEVLAQAKKEGKLVFVDCYTTWCGPCKMLSTQVFPQKKVGDYFNKTFVSLKLDMEKGEGLKMKDKFAIRAYPTLLFFDADGNEVNRIVGAERDADKFIAAVKMGVGDQGLAAMKKRYEGGERDTAFLAAYIKVLDAAYDAKGCNQVASELLDGRGADLLTNANLYNAFIDYCNSPLSPAFQYVLEHKDDFTAKYDARRLDMKMKSTWMSYPRTFVTKDAEGKVSYDEEAMKAYKKEMKKWKVAEADEIVLSSDINVAEQTGNWKEYAKLCSKYIKKYGENDMSIYNWALRIQKNCNDRKVRDTAIGWMNTRIKHLDEEKAKQAPLKPGEVRAMSMMDFSQYYKKMIAELEK